MITHEQRVETAEKLASLLLAKYGDEILLGGIYGSVAKETDTDYSDLEMFFIVKDESSAKTFNFAFRSIPVHVEVKKLSIVEKDIVKVNIEWPYKMGMLFNLKVTCGDKAILKRFRKLLEGIPNERFNEYIARYTPLCCEGLGRLKSVKLRGNTHEAGLFVSEVLGEQMLLVALFNRGFINHSYLGGLPESFHFKYLPQNYEQTVRKLMNWHSLGLEETIVIAERFVQDFISFLDTKGIKIEDNTPLEEAVAQCEVLGNV